MNALAMIGGLLVTIYLAAQAAIAVVHMFSGGMASTAVQDADYIANHIKSNFGGNQNGSTNFSSVSNALAISTASVPRSMLNGDGQTIKGPWSTSYVNLSSSADGGSFYETWSGVPASACSELANAAAVNYINVNGTQIGFSPTSSVSTAVAQACNGTAGAMNNIVLSYVMNFE
ncbi:MULTISPECIES: type 4 pilus major pilin [Asaia]|uniref:Type 4 secretion system PilS N-terminal domain-containing protein n=1 Tax=Asaia bogorensis TaxID=91915 RepID=A0A060QLS0_9PROT|nr:MULTISPECIES: type 4 pilus major pilin [Asaia]ETC99459.1 hypothetical protein P792_03175 [Asaia sp. SF2.1]CDG41006.1 hypothetical protein ASAP_2961 [Asaia bogorensis]